MFREFWFKDAAQGDAFAASLIWHHMASDVAHSDLPHREFLAEALHAFAKASTGKEVLATARKYHILARKPGRKQAFEAEHRWRSLAAEVFSLIGEARGRPLDEACTRVLAAEMPNSLAPDLRALKRAYRSYLPVFIEIRNLENECLAERQGS